MIEAEFRQVPAVKGGPAILTAIAEEEAVALERLASGKDVLEIGSAYGYSAIRMAQADARVLTIDSHAGVNNGSLEQLDANVRGSGVGSRVFCLTGRSADVLSMLMSTGAWFEGIFVDGGERETAEDITAAWTMLRPGGWLARHDYGEARSFKVAQALDKAFPDGPDELVRTLWIKHRPGPNKRKATR